jgi:beta-amylase
MGLNVMSPLCKFENFDELKIQLQKLKTIGVDGITTDVWWGDVEKMKNKYNWEYYDDLMKTIIEEGMSWIPILSFHACGCNVNDDTYVSLPKYIFDEHLSQDLGFMNSNGDCIHEYISFWYDDQIIKRYSAFMKAFHDHFHSYFIHMNKIYISFGPAGELRYPSYNLNSGWKYPEAGKLQCYSPLARKDFVVFLTKKYKSVETINKSWGSFYSSIENIQPPLNCQDFFNQYQFTSKYGKDVLQWYEDTLLNHFEKIAFEATKIFGEKKIKLGGKISGIHWKYFVGNLAEKAAGYVDHSYERVMKLFAKHRFELTITCLEMENSTDSGIEHILQKLHKQSKKHKVTLNGENALPLYVYENNNQWDLIAKNIRLFNIRSFTILRWGNILNVHNTDDVLRHIVQYIQTPLVANNNNNNTLCNKLFF